MNKRSFFCGIILLVLIAFKVDAQSQKTIIKKEKFNINKAGEDEIGYTQAVKVGNTIYISGAVGWGKTQDALKLVYDELEKSLKYYHATFENVVKENLYALALDSVIKYKDIRKFYYKNDFPAATWVQVSRLYNEGLVVEVELVAVLPEE
jgi:2-iminobutanoate/2-iminopropanoate deaminase